MYADSRPVVYRWQQPSSYGSAYSYSSNPLSSFLQNSWLPWGSAGRQPVQPVQAAQPLQAQPLQPQPLGAPVATAQQVQAQPQQPQQPLQAFWAFLPWNNNVNSAAAAQQQQPGPILSFLQNPSAVLPSLPWAQQGSRPASVVYTTPLAPSHAAGAAPAAIPVSASLTAAPAAPELQVMSEASPASHSVKGLVLDGDLPATASFGENGIRRIALHDVVHADGLPCAQEA